MSAAAKLDASALKAGDFLSRISYMRVLGVDGDSVEVENKDGFRWSVRKSILEAEACAADQFSTEQKVTRTELARILEQDVRDSVFSACFTKLPDPRDQEALLDGADISTTAKRRRLAKELTVGKERVIFAHITDTHEMGRLPVHDLEAKGERLVDLRTVKWVVFGNTKYEVK
jgi:hypothetical protein